MIMPGIGGSGIKSFDVAFKVDEPQEISLGGGLLFVRTIGGQSTEFYAIDYWSTKIEKISGSSNPLFAEVSKSANSDKIIVKTTYNRTLRFLFLGE